MVSHLEEVLGHLLRYGEQRLLNQEGQPQCRLIRL
jgi:hypothetical protein